MESLIYANSQDTLIKYITRINRNYKISLDIHDYIKYIDPNGEQIDHYVLDPVTVIHSQIKPKFRMYRKNKDSLVVKVIMPRFTITFPQYHNISYPFNETSLSVIIKPSNFAVAYDDIESFFYNGIKNYLIRTIDSILSTEFVSDNNYGLLSTDYNITIS